MRPVQEVRETEATAEAAAAREELQRQQAERDRRDRTEAVPAGAHHRIAAAAAAEMQVLEQLVMLALVPEDQELRISERPTRAAAAAAFTRQAVKAQEVAVPVAAAEAAPAAVHQLPELLEPQIQAVAAAAAEPEVREPDPQAATAEAESW